MSDPTFRQAPSVPRSPIDDYYNASVPAPFITKDVATVVSVEGDSVTVDMDGEIISGIVLSSGTVTPGNDIEIEKRNDLWVTQGDPSSQVAASAVVVQEAEPVFSTETGINVGGSMREPEMWELSTDDWTAAWGESDVTLTAAPPTQYGWLISTEVFEVTPGEQIDLSAWATVLAGTSVSLRTYLYLASEDTDLSAVLDGDAYTVRQEQATGVPTVGNAFHWDHSFTIPDTITPPGLPQPDRINHLHAPRSESGVAPWATTGSARITASADGWYSMSGIGTITLSDIVLDGAGLYQFLMSIRNSVGVVSVAIKDVSGSTHWNAGAWSGDITLQASDTLPDNGPFSMVFTLGDTSAASLEVRNMLIEKNDTAGNYFDGSLPGHQWLGTPWASKSLRPEAAVGVDPVPPKVGRLGVGMHSPASDGVTEIRTFEAVSVIANATPVGMLWWKPSESTMRVWDGTSWQAI